MTTVGEGTALICRLQAVHDRIAQAAVRSGRLAGAVSLLPATKTVPAERLRTMINAGGSCGGVPMRFGENRVQEGYRKAMELADQAALRWTLIGHLQTNKVKEALGFVDQVHSLDRLRLAVSLDRYLQQAGRSIEVLVQVNTSHDVSKYGLPVGEVGKFIANLRACHSLRPRGFMTLAVFTSDHVAIRECFRTLREVRDQMRETNADLEELSMGMSGDFEVAVEEGATIVRVGEAIFGPRPGDDVHWWPNASRNTYPGAVKSKSGES